MPLRSISFDLVQNIRENYPGMTTLNLAHNDIEVVEHLGSLQYLEDLDLSHNRIREFREGESRQLQMLATLNLSHNQICNLEALARLEALECLDLSYNQLTDVRQLEYLSRLKNLRELRLKGNPIYDDPSYRYILRKLLPQLEYLDDRHCAVEEQPGQMGSEQRLKDQIEAREGVHESRADESPGKQSRTTMDGLSERMRWIQDDSCPSSSPYPVLDQTQASYWNEIHRTGRGNDEMKDEQISQLEKALEQEKLSGKSGDSRMKEKTELLWMQRENRFRLKMEKLEAENKSLAEKLAVANTKLRASDQILQIQEAELAKAKTEMRALTAKTNSRAFVHADNQSESTCDSRTISGKKFGLERMHLASNALAFEKLLRAWREKVFAFLVREKASTITTEREAQQAQKEVQDLQESVRTLQDEKASLQYNLENAEATIACLKQSIKDLQRKCEEGERTFSECQQENDSLKTALTTTTLQISKFMKDFMNDRLYCGLGASIQKAARSLDVYAKRLAFASGRLETLFALMGAEQVRLRNTRAALEADRRVLSRRIHTSLAADPRNPPRPRYTASAPVPNMGENSKRGVKRNARRMSKMKPAVDKPNGLKAATELALRSIFLKLEGSSTGMVDARTLFGELRRNREIAALVLADQGSKESSRRWHRFIDMLEAQVSRQKKKLGPGWSDRNITWGEFLLMFIPAVEDDNEMQDGVDPDLSHLLETRMHLGQLSTKFRLIRVDPEGNRTMVAAENGENKPGSAVLRDESPSSRKDSAHTLLASDFLQNSSDTSLEPTNIEDAQLQSEVLALLKERRFLLRQLQAEVHDRTTLMQSLQKQWECKVNEQAFIIRQLELDQTAAERLREFSEMQSNDFLGHFLRDKADVMNLRQKLVHLARLQEEEKAELLAEHRREIENVASSMTEEKEQLLRELGDLRKDRSKLTLKLRHMERDSTRQIHGLQSDLQGQIDALETLMQKRNLDIQQLRKERNAALSLLRKKTNAFQEAPSRQSVASAEESTGCEAGIYEAGPVTNEDVSTDTDLRPSPVPYRTDGGLEDASSSALRSKRLRPQATNHPEDIDPVNSHSCKEFEKKVIVPKSEDHREEQQDKRREGEVPSKANEGGQHHAEEEVKNAKWQAKLDDLAALSRALMP